MALALKIKIEKDEGVGVGLVKKKATGMQEVFGHANWRSCEERRGRKLVGLA